MLRKLTMGKALMIGVALCIVAFGVRADQKALDEETMQNLVGGANCYSLTQSVGCTAIWDCQSGGPYGGWKRAGYTIDVLVSDFQGYYHCTYVGSKVGCDWLWFDAGCNSYYTSSQQMFAQFSVYDPGCGS